MSDLSNLPAGDCVMVPLARISCDEADQTRVKVRPAVVREYAAAMKDQLDDGGLRFPPVVLFKGGEDYWVGDGFHRILAASKAELTHIAAHVHPGTRRDALLFGITANSMHGLPRTAADKRKAVALLLADDEWRQWSDREIGRRCQVTHTFVASIRRSASGVGHQMRKVQRSGRVYEMKAQKNPVAQAAATEKTPAPREPSAATCLDLVGIPVPESRAPLFAARDDFAEAESLFERLAAVLDRIARQPAGELYREEMLRTSASGQVGFACAALRASRAKLFGAQPYCSFCPNCRPTHPDRPYPSCKTCGGRGWTTRSRYEACGQAERQELLKMAASSMCT